MVCYICTPKCTLFIQSSVSRDPSEIDAQETFIISVGNSCYFCRNDETFFMNLMDKKFERTAFFCHKVFISLKNNDDPKLLNSGI